MARLAFFITFVVLKVTIYIAISLPLWYNIINSKGNGGIEMAKKEITVAPKAGLYIRVSSKAQAEEGYSLDAQERKLRAYCDMQGYEIAGIYKDEGISGKTANRTELKRLLADVAKSNIQKVVVVKVDRISRNTRDMLNIVETLKKTSTSFICINDNIDTSTATGTMFLTILSAVAQFESDIGRERTLLAKEELSRQGKFAGGNIAYGYDYDVEAKEFNVNTNEEIVVTRIFAECMDGVSAGKIAIGLNNDSIATKRNGTWQAKQVLSILKNRFYTGQLEWQGIINKGTHEAIISDRQFSKVQKLLNA